MWRRITGLLGISVWLALAQVATSGAATGASPVATPPLDLAAMVVFPQDLETPGFVVNQGRSWGPEWFVNLLVTDFGTHEEAARKAVSITGVKRRYELELIQSWPSDAATPAPVEGGLGQRLITAVTEYESADYASIGFDYYHTLIESDGNLPPGMTRDDWPLAAPIGDQAEYTLTIGPGAEGGVSQTGNLTFRVGNLVGDVYLETSLGAAPDQAEVEAIARQLLARMERGQAGDTPGLGSMAMPFEGFVYSDSYTQIDREAVPQNWFAAQAWQDLPGLPRSLAVYTRDQEATGGATTIFMLISLMEFASPEEASQYPLDAPRRQMAANPGSLGYSDIADAPAPAALGDAASAFTFGHPADSGFGDWHGYAITLRSGAYVALVSLEQPGAVTPEAALALANLQLACLETGSCIELLPLPAALLAPAATPAPATALTTPVG